ncbi:monovalent cation/H+ antiporter complex subunit F [Marinisporobacter balticus]|uniref:Multisubunit sodium/proton antiporter MrpF subunit n=1 Tax=Marinisporobacter balticus TaxID=2018667 RepID=A0A4R2KPA2_9FIRM|nr:monovalent cation/H+ antiporter complex subunit F [Marinisporobacter balticus]TCO72669.1 multisubunit sodium/proton antiporter MrpF subunit [Marinisporobacter balticus]
MIHKLLVLSCLILSFTIALCMIRAIKGPSAADRLIAINVIGTKTILLISMISFIFKETYFIDVVLVYALISFVASIVISNFIEKAGGKSQ